MNGTRMTQQEINRVLAWHDVGLSIRDIREMMTTDPRYPGPVRDKETIRKQLRSYGREPHPSDLSPKPGGGKDEFCENLENHPKPVRRQGARNECRVCKTKRATERRHEIRQGLAERLILLQQLGGDAAEIADWIEENVRVA